jgi:hypothetical protein
VSSLDDNPNCAETHASFRLGGDGLIAAEVNRRLGLTPDFVSERGDKDRSGRKTRTQRTGVWLISSQRELDTTSLEQHLLFLLGKIEPVSEALREVIEQQQLEADFFCYWASSAGHGGPVLTPEVLRRIADLGALLDIDFYDVSPEYEPESGDG